MKSFVVYFTKFGVNGIFSKEVKANDYDHARITIRTIPNVFSIVHIFEFKGVK